ncbi:HAD-IIIC family phosphatase [Streptomyces sp. NPDC046976]|uniref:HAD-IIIC family phosphatase n=1 Tax=Streptomyces sp. NPDC046976 TaxID=3155258 RepID=UPI0033CE1B0A
MAAPTTEGSERETGDTLLTLHLSGRLAAEYPRVRGLLAGCSETELLRAGNLLSRLHPEDVEQAHPGVPVVSVAVTGHGTLAPLVPALTAELARHGLLLRPHLTDYDSYVFDLSDPGSTLHRFDADVVLCVLDPAVVLDELPVPWTPEDVERAWDEKLGLLTGLVTRYRSTGRGTLVLNTVPLPALLPAQLLEHRSRARLGAVWRQANSRLLELAQNHPNLVVLDLDPLVAEGIAVTDERLSQYAKVHLAPPLLARYAREVGHLTRHLTGRTKKALLLDLDGTLWNGTLGEDGFDVLQGDHSEPFRFLQRVVKQLGSQGVLLGVVSKNDVEPVRAVLREHPRMVLRENDLVTIVANWRPKHENITGLAGTLNLGTDSFVFMDDTAAECGLVEAALPDVTVLRAGAEPAHHVATLLRDGWFDTLVLTTEDRARVEKYQQEAERRDFLQQSGSVEEYLRLLGVRVRLSPVAPSEVARVSQLSLRTNQFNMALTRLQPADVERLVAGPATTVLAVHAADRFGDNGLVGAVFLRRAADAVHIDGFLLSCRVFSRGIEQACLGAVLHHARAAGATAVLGEHRRGPKNGAVRDLYPRHGFRQITDDGTTTVFRHDLDGEDVPVPAHLQFTDQCGGDTP